MTHWVPTSDGTRQLRTAAVRVRYRSENNNTRVTWSSSHTWWAILSAVGGVSSRTLSSLTWWVAQRPTRAVTRRSDHSSILLTVILSHYGMNFRKKRLRERQISVPHSNKIHINQIYSFSSYFFKQIFAQGSSYIVSASSPGGIFVLQCSTEQENFGASWLGLQSGKFKNLEALSSFP